MVKRNPLIRSYPKKVNNPLPKKSAGILDDHAVRKVISTKEITGNPKLNEFTPGSILFADADKKLAEDNTNFFWDNVNKRMGIGGTDISTPVNPTEPLHINGNARISGNNRLKIDF